MTHQTVGSDKEQKLSVVKTSLVLALFAGIFFTGSSFLVTSFYSMAISGINLLSIITSGVSLLGLIFVSVGILAIRCSMENDC